MCVKHSFVFYFHSFQNWKSFWHIELFTVSVKCILNFFFFFWILGIFHGHICDYINLTWLEPNVERKKCNRILLGWVSWLLKEEWFSWDLLVCRGGCWRWEKLQSELVASWEKWLNHDMHFELLLSELGPSFAAFQVH